MSVSINKILIANRGEIALRIIRAAGELGIPTVAVYTPEEAGAPWVEKSSESCSLGDGQMTQTYLNMHKILEIARRTGADAIHPGYGFLSENHHFARACRERSLNFIGPSPEVLELMGDKIAAHHFVADLGIAVPEKIFRSPDEILAMDEVIDYPVLVKAAAGGGGKGMRLIQHGQELNAILTSASSEALNYFGDDRIYLERYLRSPRHIEVQLLGDKQGQLVHLFERECSIQRRHQKIIEEAPAAILPESIRQQLIQAALTIGRAVNYFSAGTVEFLLDGSGAFYFLEMNPRIQVEHGITEMITGVDIVKEQIAIAGGMPLSINAKSIQRNGHAMEARICAEDPENDLLPSPGKIGYYCEPSFRGLRIDSAVSSGSVISPEYDPLIAKVLVHAGDRDEAIRELGLALKSFVITGVQHNIPLIRAILMEENFRKNLVSTTYLNERLQEFSQDIKKQRSNMPHDMLALVATIRVVMPDFSSPSQSPWQSMGYWRNVPRLTLRIDHRIMEVEYYHNNPGSMDFIIQDKPYYAKDIFMDDHQIIFWLENVKYAFYYQRRPDGTIEVSDGMLSYMVERSHRLLDGEITDEPADHDNGDGVIRTPLPGKVIRMHARINDMVGRGDPLLVIESMKLENSILATCKGKIQDIRIKEGDLVRKNDILLVIHHS